MTKRATVAGVDVADTLEIERLVARYCFAIDDGDTDEFVRCFAPAGRFWNGDELMGDGHEGLRRMMSGLGSRGQMRHVTTSILLENTGDDTMRARSYCCVMATNNEDGHFIMTKGVYEDRLSRLGGEWVFAERRFVGDR